MASKQLALVLALGAALAACDSTETPKRPGERASDSQGQTLQRARDVEHTVQQQAERQRQHIEHAAQ